MYYMILHGLYYITPHLNVFILHLHLNDFTQHEMI